MSRYSNDGMMRRLAANHGGKTRGAGALFSWITTELCSRLLEASRPLFHPSAAEGASAISTFLTVNEGRFWNEKKAPDRKASYAGVQAVRQQLQVMDGVKLRRIGAAKFGRRREK